VTEISKTVETTRIIGYTCDVCDSKLLQGIRSRIIRETEDHWHESDFCDSCYRKVENFIKSLGGVVHKKW
jgi:hypothetical protein